MKKVSIIVPIYNVEKYLSKCLDSVVNQTFKDLEIICVNDGSTDGSLKILEKYAQKDERIKIVSRENGGLSAARNSGLDNVTTEYVYFLDSDDWIELDTIEKLYNIITTNDVDVVVHGVINIPEDDSCTSLSNETQVWLDSFKTKSGVYDVPIEINSKIVSVSVAKLYKMDIINQYSCRFAEGLINEDELFLWTYMIHCQKYYYLDEKLYNYLRRKDSIMGKRDNSPKILDILDIQEKIYKTVEECKNIEDYQKYLTQNYINMVNYLFQRMPKIYRKEVLAKIKYYYENVNKNKEILTFYKNIKLKLFIQEIFSLKNTIVKNEKCKVLTVLGFQLVFRRKNA